MRARPVVLAVLLATAAAAQPGRQERRTVAWHASLLGELWRAARAEDPTTLAALDAALLAPQEGNPFAPLARAAAALAGVALDGPRLARSMIHLNALPEVVDPEVFEDDAGTQPYRLHVTLHTPFVLAEPGPYRFTVELRDQAGKVIDAQALGPASSDDLARFVVKAAIAVDELADGAYTVVARADVGDRPWRPGDPESVSRVALQRGFAARARRQAARTAELAAGAAPEVRGALLGAGWPVQRVYGGEAPDGEFDLGADLRHAERVLDNVAAGRRPLAGAGGWFALCVLVAEPGSDEPRPVRLRVRPAAPRTDERGGLVLFVPGNPTWDGVWSRPGLVRGIGPGWLAAALRDGGFDAAGRWTLAVMESPGELREPGRAVAEVVAGLAPLLAVDPARAVLVGEREGAAAVLTAWQAGRLPAAPRGVVLAVHGGIGREDVERVAKSPVLLVAGAGHPSSDNLERGARLLAEAGAADHVQRVGPERAWPWALPMALPQAEAFCAQRLR